MAEGKRLYRGADHGAPIVLRQADFAPLSRSGGWGSYADSFLKANERALQALDVTPSIVATRTEPTIHLTPGGRTGAVPLRSAQTGRVATGLLIEPRFGWAGVGRVMSQTGWAASPEFIDLPLVPGSAREVPPWVLAGPVLARLSELLRNMGRDFDFVEAVVSRPRGSVVWSRYISESLARGEWHRVPCRYPELAQDPLLRRAIRWAIERVRGDLLRLGGQDGLSLYLAELALRLLDDLRGVVPERPSGPAMHHRLLGQLPDLIVRNGLEALGWVVDERGLGGGKEMDGLAWHLPLEQLWERYVEADVRREVAATGGIVRVGRLGETAFPISWSQRGAGSMTHLVPDIVVRRGNSVQIVDAKYKAHFADLDTQGWKNLGDATRESHRADLHQVLAYASLYSAEAITATLVYPLRWETWADLEPARRHVAVADLVHQGRSIRLELRGLPFGRPKAA